jgi:hypothetical protein
MATKYNNKLVGTHLTQSFLRILFTYAKVRREKRRVRDVT